MIAFISRFISRSSRRPEGSLLDERQVANEREVIRRQAGERRVMDAELCGMQGGVHENVIDREGGEAGGGKVRNARAGPKN